MSKKSLCYAATLAVLLVPGLALAATTGTEFQPAYQFFYDAATGYLGRGIAIVGGLVGLGYGVAKGKALPAIIGVTLIIFGAFGPTLIDAMFSPGVPTGWPFRPRYPYWR